MLQQTHELNLQPFPTRFGTVGGGHNPIEGKGSLSMRCRYCGRAGTHKFGCPIWPKIENCSCLVTMFNTVGSRGMAVAFRGSIPGGALIWKRGGAAWMDTRTTECGTRIPDAGCVATRRAGTASRGDMAPALRWATSDRFSDSRERRFQAPVIPYQPGIKPRPRCASIPHGGAA